ncbi:hypothetical protein GCM10010361_53550 [Streptomyces olivaceiscleroticus]|uniref:Uncharacterized protein n=1 Tax=Streptomyces olivaceiscleroticus TaxID=68245 RepID=A0ABP3KND8_9ACTN
MNGTGVSPGSSDVSTGSGGVGEPAVGVGEPALGGRYNDRSLGGRHNDRSLDRIAHPLVPIRLVPITGRPLGPGTVDPVSRFGTRGLPSRQVRGRIAAHALSLA